MSLDGLVVASYGRRYRVEVPGGEALDCVTRGKRTDLACGDRVVVQRSGAGLGIIQDMRPRASLLYRSDAYREKLIAANVTQVLVVAAVLPLPHETLIDRCLVAAGHGRMAAAIALNKSDLPEHGAARDRLSLYEALGYRVVPFSAKRDISPLHALLEGQVSVLVGQSGVGKSTIVNRLVPSASARTDEISRALGSGRHTTTHARFYHLDDRSHIIDSPGMQAFGLHHVAAVDLARGFVEFQPHIGHCRFRDCRHLAEPGCAIQAACDEGSVAARRLAAYRVLLRERELQPRGGFNVPTRKPP
ncbi:MAG: ribosome small subunit-dependent GTPase A [Betaproteobacteria bacterium]